MSPTLRGFLGTPLPLFVLALLSASVALFVRAPDGAGLALLLAVSGPRLLLALAVGAGLGAAGALVDARGPQPRREVLLQGLACGAAVGAVLLASGGTLPVETGLGVGALLGGGLFVALLLALGRVGAASHLATGAALALMLGAAVVAAVGAKGEALDRAWVWWWLGDFGTASAFTAAFAAGAVAGLLAVAVRGRRGAGTPVAWALYGVAFGCGGIVPWVSLMAPLAARWFVEDRRGSTHVLASAALGALALVWADALPRLLGAGYAPPAGVAVAFVALPWFLVWGGRGHGRVLRAADYTLAGTLAALGVGVAGVLTYLVRVLG